jgi:hypothetical protein
LPNARNGPQTIHRDTRGYPAGYIALKSMSPWEKQQLYAATAALIN